MSLVAKTREGVTEIADLSGEAGRYLVFTGLQRGGPVVEGARELVICGRISAPARGATDRRKIRPIRHTYSGVMTWGGAHRNA